ncbi:MAG: phosphomannomutase/phosphoglucomutase [Patescibacteria group bacterium]
MPNDILEKIFRQYDIRGEYPNEINSNIAYLLGWSLANFFQKKTEKTDILVGHDNRRSSLPLFEALTDGVLDSGSNAFSLGLCTSPMFYFASGHYGFDEGGVMITASHLPKQYNGFKLVRDFPDSVDIGSGLVEIKSMMGKRIFQRERGKMTEKSILKDYVESILRDTSLENISLKIVIDTANSATGIVIPEIFKNTGMKIYQLFPELDDDFPGRPLNCTDADNLKELKKWVLERKADFGVAFDGDGDRVVFLDEKGNFISPAVITAFLASILLKENPGEKILYTVNQSRVIPEVIEKEGGRAVICQVGHSNIKKKMREENILFGGEASAHYYSRSQYFAESPFFVLFKIIKQVSKSKKPISELVKPFQKYFNSGEINFDISDPKNILIKLEEKFKEGKILEIDGLRVDFKDWWFNIRPSHTEDVLRMVVEAKSQELMEEKKKELSALIQG